MGNITFIFSNYYIDVAFLAWLIAQVLKTLLAFFLTKEIVWERMVGAGGMPSSHSALVCSLTVALERKLGFTSPEFAIALVIAAVVMYDAMGVRRAAGEQAKVLNKIVELTYDNIKEMFMPEKKVDIKNLFIRRKNMEIDPEEARKREEGRALLKELLGHTPLEVLAGAVLGIPVAMLIPVF